MSVKNGDEVKECQLVVFRIGDELYGVDVRQVREIIKVRKARKIPNAPPYVHGVIDLRGQITLIIDLHAVLGTGSAYEVSDEGRIIIVDNAGTSVGILVDAVIGVIRIPRDSIESPPIISSDRMGYVVGIARHNSNLIVVIDVKKLIESLRHGFL